MSDGDHEVGAVRCVVAVCHQRDKLRSAQRFVVTGSCTVEDMDEVDVALAKVEPHRVPMVDTCVRDLVERHIRCCEHVAGAGVERHGLDPIRR